MDTVKTCTLDPHFSNLPFLNEQQQLGVKQEVVTEAGAQWKKAQAEAKKSHTDQLDAEFAKPPKRIKKEAGGKLSSLLGKSKGDTETVSSAGCHATDASRFRCKLEKEVLLYFTEESIPIDEDP